MYPTYICTHIVVSQIGFHLNHLVLFNLPNKLTIIQWGGGSLFQETTAYVCVCVFLPWATHEHHTNTKCKPSSKPCCPLLGYIITGVEVSQWYSIVVRSRSLHGRLSIEVQFAGWAALWPCKFWHTSLATRNCSMLSHAAVPKTTKTNYHNLQWNKAEMEWARNGICYIGCQVSLLANHPCIPILGQFHPMHWPDIIDRRSIWWWVASTSLRCGIKVLMFMVFWHNKPQTQCFTYFKHSSSNHFACKYVFPAILVGYLHLQCAKVHGLRAISKNTPATSCNPNRWLHSNLKQRNQVAVVCIDLWQSRLAMSLTLSLHGF